MMTAKEHANLIGILSYVFAGIQGFMTLFFGAYALIMAAIFVAAAVGGDANDVGGIVVTAVFTAIFGIISVLGLTSIYMNVKLGRRLRSDDLPSSRSMKFTAILNICSLFYGGMVALPFGAALGGYELWFATSDIGKRFLSGTPEAEPIYMNPPPAQAYAPARASG